MTRKLVGLPGGSKIALRCAGAVTVLWVCGTLYAAVALCGTFPGCLALNEWGDYAAGAFAPLAFMWLVVAVFIQSRELAEQRGELQLTRLEFESNREVMKAQVDEARRQAELVKDQIDMLRAAEQDRALRVHFDLLQQWVRRELSGDAYLTTDTPADSAAFFVELVRRLLRVAHEVHSNNNRSPLEELLQDGVDNLYYICERLRDIAMLESSLSPAMQTMIPASMVGWMSWEFVPLLPRPSEANASRLKSRLPYSEI